MTQRYCTTCHLFHDKKVPCPGCGGRENFNKSLYTAKLNGQLHKQAESAVNERKRADALRRGYDQPPSKWAKQKAKEIVAGL